MSYGVTEKSYAIGNDQPTFCCRDINGEVRTNVNNFLNVGSSNNVGNVSSLPILNRTVSLTIGSTTNYYRKYLHSKGFHNWSPNYAQSDLQRNIQLTATHTIKFMAREKKLTKCNATNDTKWVLSSSDVRDHMNGKEVAHIVPLIHSVGKMVPTTSILLKKQVELHNKELHYVEEEHIKRKHHSYHRRRSTREKASKDIHSLDLCSVMYVRGSTSDSLLQHYGWFGHFLLQHHTQQIRTTLIYVIYGGL